MNKNILACPKCSSQGRSVAALNYEETKVWDKSGDFSGVGVGAGTFGVGVGAGMGSYSEKGVMQTKRAATFVEPKPFSFPILPILLFFIAAILAVTHIGDISGALSNNAGVSAAPVGANGGVLVQGTEKLTDFVLASLSWLAPIIIAGFGFMAWQDISARKAAENKLNETVYPKRLARYNELFYCAHCHTLFDEAGRHESATDGGFEKMMDVDPVS